MSVAEVRQQIDAASLATQRRLGEFVVGDEGVCVVKAPPGSGKTWSLLHAVEEAFGAGLRVAVAAQTNAQVTDICERMLADHPGVNLWRFASSRAEPPAHLPNLNWATKLDELPTSRCVVVGTTAKWSLISFDKHDPFDLVVVDEAWQMDWASFMLLGQVAGRFVLIGDPGQIPPTVRIDVRRWETSPRAPHQAAPELILADPSIDKVVLDLPSCRRLPCDSVDLIRTFYDFHFEAWAAPGERWLRPGGGNGHALDSVIDAMGAASACIATLPTPESGPPLDHDEEVAAAAAGLAVRLLERGAKFAADEGAVEALEPHHIGISATHKIMNAAVVQALPAGLAGEGDGHVRVDTPERWQGLERPVMILIHPLSGVVRPSAFDLETGRLCVMASRHRSSMVIVSRDHVPETLANHIPAAEQAVGRPDITGRGHTQHVDLWARIAEAGQVVAL